MTRRLLLCLALGAAACGGQADSAADAPEPGSGAGSRGPGSARASTAPGSGTQPPIPQPIPEQPIDAGFILACNSSDSPLVQALQDGSAHLDSYPLARPGDDEMRVITNFIDRPCRR